MKKDRILLYTDVLCPGGAQRQLVELSRLLKKRDYDVSILDYWDNTFYDNYLTKLGIPFKHTNSKGALAIIWALIKQILSQKPDVVIAYLPNPTIAACIAKILLPFRRFKLIVSERNTSQENGRAERFRFNLFRIADYVIPNSHTQYNFIICHYPFLKKKTRVITNYVDTNRFCPVAANYDKDDSVRKCIVVGRIVEQKNVIRFIEAIKLVKEIYSDFVVDWYGNPHPAEYFEKCNSIIKKYNLEEYIRFHPAVNNIEEKYKESDIFILPSIYEGFPNVLCEAMASGLPVAVSNVCDNPRIMKEGVNGVMFDPYDINAISKGIVTILSIDKASLEKMGIFSREISLSCFSENVFVENYLKLINGK